MAGFLEFRVSSAYPHIEAKPGDYVIVKNDEEEATFKQLKVCGETTVLHPLNAKYPDIEVKKKNSCRLVGKVVEKKRY